MSFLWRFGGRNLTRLGPWLGSGRIDPLLPETDLDIRDDDGRTVPPYVVTEISFVCGRKYHSTRNSVKPVS
jgi:hypothetical protein